MAASSSTGGSGCSPRTRGPRCCTAARTASTGDPGRSWTRGDRITLQLVSPDGDAGFPGRLVVTVTYAVSPGRVRIDLRAETDAPTVVNMTNHSYFNLDGEGCPDHPRACPPGRCRPLPTNRAGRHTHGELCPVEGTPFDLREPRVLGEGTPGAAPPARRCRGLDHTCRPWVRDAGACRSHGSPDRLRLAVSSDQPGIQVYTGHHLQPLPVGTSGRSYLPGPESPWRPTLPGQPAPAGFRRRSCPPETFFYDDLGHHRSGLGRGQASRHPASCHWHLRCSASRNATASRVKVTGSGAPYGLHGLVGRALLGHSHIDETRPFIGAPGPTRRAGPVSPAYRNPVSSTLPPPPPLHVIGS